MEKMTEKFELPPVAIRQIEGCLTELELEDVAVAYARVFAGKPWNEVSRCADGFSCEPAGSLCELCGESRSEAYPLEEQMKVIANELSRPGAACFVLEDERSNEIVGFSWGFCYENVDELIEQKYVGESAEYEQLRSDVRRVLSDYGLGDDPIYYLSETGIVDDPRYRGRGISKDFTRLRMELPIELGLDVVQRTSAESPMYRTMLGAGFTEVMGPRMDVSDVTDSQRVLFVKKVEEDV